MGKVPRPALQDGGGRLGLGWPEMISVRSRGRVETLELEVFEQRVREGKILPSTQVRLPVVTGADYVRAEELEIFQRLHAPARLAFVRAFSLGRFPHFTLLLCTGQIVLFLILAGPNRFIALDPLIRAGAKARPNILELGQTWRLLSANFLHRDVLHLFVNSFFLFNLGGAIENTFRLRDYLWILLVSAVGTTVLSTLMSSSLASVGASGMVLGLFGSASVFGYVYGRDLPPRYRRYFGSAVLPYALFILYLGLASPDTDNWGHLGGFLGGLLATLPLAPRGLVQGGSWKRWWSSAASLALVGSVIALGPVIRKIGLVFEPVRDERSGLAFVYPAYWKTGQNHLGYVAKGNSLGTALGVRAERRSSAPYTLRETRQWFLEQELQARAADGDITQLEVGRERPFFLDGARAIEIDVELESRAGPQVSRNVLVQRGYYRYAIVLSAPAEWAEEYDSLLERLVEQVRLVEPASLKDARALVERFPGMTSARVDLGHELARIGAVEEAKAVFMKALDLDPNEPSALYGLAKLEADFDGDLELAESMALAVFLMSPKEPEYVALLADLRRRLGRIDEACEALQRGFQDIERPPEHLRRRVIELRCFRGS